MKTGNGKIANLPSPIQEELNYRMNDGEQGNELVEWLNAKPEVAEVVNKLFDGRPISEQNLSQWRTHGYRLWHAHRTIVDGTLSLSDNTGDIAETGIDCDKLLLTLTAAYAEAIQNWTITPGEQMLYKLAVYKNLTNGVIALRRAELLKVRLEIARARLELLLEKQRSKSAASSSSRPSASADNASPECAASSSPAHAQTPEPHRPVIPSPRPTHEPGAPKVPLPATAASLPGAELPAPASAPKPAGPENTPLWPSRRPGGPPRNASPRNPLGLL